MSGPAPAVAAVRGAVRGALADVPTGATVLVACSGGPDSLALAAGLAFVARGARWRAGAVVVDHGLQAGSDEVAARAAAACRLLGLDPVVVRRVAVSGPGGPEAAARGARHAALLAVAGETGAAAVLLGHTLDDQAETVLLGLARGSGPRSLAGMSPVRGLLRRPLLAVTRAQTLAACAAQDLDPWHDPTNAEGPNLRSRVRGQVLPLLEDVLGPGVAAALARTAVLAREQADALDEIAAALLVRASATPPPAASEQVAPRGHTCSDVPPPAPAASEQVAPRGHTCSDVGGEGGKGGAADGDGRRGWDAGTLAGAPDGVRRAALHAAAIAAGVPAGSLTRGHVLALDELLADWSGQGAVSLPGGVEGVRRYGRLYLLPKEHRPTTRE